MKKSERLLSTAGHAALLAASLTLAPVAGAADAMSGMAGMSGMGGMSGMSGMQGMSGMGGMSGMSGMQGMGGMSGMSGMQGMGGMSGMAGGGALAEGKEIAFSRRLGNCLACHQIEGGQSPGDVGPPLMMMKMRFPDRGVLRAQIWDPQVRNPDTVMPPFGRHKILSEAELDKVTDFIWSL